MSFGMFGTIWSTRQRRQGQRPSPIASHCIFHRSLHLPPIAQPSGSLPHLDPSQPSCLHRFSSFDPLACSVQLYRIELVRHIALLDVIGMHIYTCQRCVRVCVCVYVCVFESLGTHAQPVSRMPMAWRLTFPVHQSVCGREVSTSKDTVTHPARLARPPCYVAHSASTARRSIECLIQHSC